jgi:hypothetical protein
MSNTKNKMASLMLKKEEKAVTAPIQKVVVVKEKITENDTPLNVRIHKDLLEEVKAHAFFNKRSLKEITTKALEQYLSNHKK